METDKFDLRRLVLQLSVIKIFSEALWEKKRVQTLNFGVEIRPSNWESVETVNSWSDFDVKKIRLFSFTEVYLIVGVLLSTSRLWNYLVKFSTHFTMRMFGYNIP